MPAVQPPGRTRAALTALAASAAVVTGLATVGGTSTSASPAGDTSSLRALLGRAATVPAGERLRGTVGGGGGESAELRTQGEQFAEARTAPGQVLPGGYTAAFTSLAALPAGGSATELTTMPYDSDDLRYRDPNASNSTGGSGHVAGRVTGVAVDPSGTHLFAGGADGGVFRSTLGSGGANGPWTPISDSLPTLSTGDLEYADGALWYATGEANTGGTSYAGSGVYRLTDPATGTFSPADRVGGTELDSTIINKVRFDGLGHVFAATNRGIFEHSSTTSAGAWTFLYAPNPDYLPGGSLGQAASAPYKNIVNDLAIQPDGTGKHLVADIAWRGGDTYNGFYRSDDSGRTWAKTNPGGAINPKEIGNAEFAYSSDGRKLYTVLESTALYNKPAGNVSSYLAGVYVSNSGSVDGPWSNLADSTKLASSGSALKQAYGYKGYGPGIQSWYNNFIQVDPKDAGHVWVGLEEVYETTNGGSTWTTPGPYWNFSFPCWSFDPAKNTCSKTTHSDQHAITVGAGRVFVGNDGGLYSRPVRGALDQYGHASDWKSHNDGLGTLQFYSVGVGTAGGQTLVSGGLQDNGQYLYRSGDAAAGSPFGGDGGDTLVDPTLGHGCNIVAEYVYLSMSVTNNCGVSDGTTPAIRSIDPGDPGARFIAPFTADTQDPDHWLAGGRYVWTQSNGYAIKSGAEWTNAFDVGAGHSITAAGLQNGTGWVTWCGPCNNNRFTRGVATNAGGTWHQVSTSGIPNRFLAGVTIDPADLSGNTAYVVVNGFSRRFTEGPGAGVGHLYRTTDGGQTWADASPSLPDVPASSLVIRSGTWYLGTDLGVLTSTDRGGSWQRVTGFPYVTVMQLKTGPDGSVYAATHGRGIWKVAA